MQRNVFPSALFIRTISQKSEKCQHQKMPKKNVGFICFGGKYYDKKIYCFCVLFLGMRHGCAGRIKS